MKKILLSLFVLVNFSNYLFSQNRENTWMLGQGIFGDTNRLKCGIHFDNGSAEVFSIKRDIGFVDCSTGICDTSGALQFYFNGIILNNKLNRQMENSDSLNSGPYNGNNWPDAEGTLILEGATTIPRPDHPNQYFLIYQNINYLGPIFGYPSLHLRYSLVDMRRDSGMGGIVPGKRLRSIVNDTLEQGAIAACKHANGRDWWIIEKDVIKNKYYKVLVTPDSMFVSSQSIGIEFYMVNFGIWAAFSPDGSKYAFLVSDFNGTDSIEVMNFDRCTGEFSNPIFWRLPNTYGVSCIFSPNSRFLYCVQNNNLYQYDTDASDIPSSLIKVDTFDGTIDSTDGIPAWFAQSQLAPDEKIYVGTWGSFLALSVINQPDSLGKACNFAQHSFALPFYNFCTPYYPNYDLEMLLGSGCDTITSVSNKPNDNWQFKVYPNPLNQWLNIEYQSQENLQCEIFDVTGRLVTHFTLYPYFKSSMYDMSGLPQGIYILKATDKEGKSAERKIVKE